MQQEGIPLLRTKLDVPPRRAHTIPRESLFELAPSQPGTRLLLLSAPAGFGKTTFLATWCHTLAAQRGTAVAWLALDESDNDPARFLAYLVASVAQAIMPDSLPIEPIGAAAEAVLIHLVNALAVIDRDVVLVLDDYHLISAPAVHAAVAFLLEHLPNRDCLAIGSRADPPLPLARLRARVLIAQGRSDPRGPALHAAQTILARLREQAAAHRRTGSLIEILALIALATAAAGCRDQARAPLQQALVLAQPEGYARIFLDEGAPMRSLARLG